MPFQNQSKGSKDNLSITISRGGSINALSPSSQAPMSAQPMSASTEGEKAKRRQMVRDGEEYKSVRKLKSGADSKKGVKGVTVQKGAEWKQPLRRHINPATDAVEFVTILVRVLSGDSEHDFHARFPPTALYARKVCDAIAEKERLTGMESSLFSLWVISKDLEIQIRPDQDIFELMVCWHRWILKYTHFPEAEDPAHHVNRHWFIYRREALVSLQLERELAGEVAVNLLFGEAKRNILTKRYVCSQLEAATIAGYQLQMAYGDWTFDKSPPGYLIKDGRLDQLLPLGLSDKMRPTQWEEIITVQYKSFMGMDPLSCKQGFLEFIRHMSCYGCSFFPVCAELPPSGFFEFRTQNWFLGAGPNGMCIVDSDIQKYVYHLYWKDITFRAGTDQFFIYQKKGDRTKEISLITPQGKLIENLATRIKYSWAKETGRLTVKNKEGVIVPAIIKSEEVAIRKNSIAVQEGGGDAPPSNGRRKSMLPPTIEQEAEQRKNRRKSMLPQTIVQEAEDRKMSRRQSKISTNEPPYESPAENNTAPRRKSSANVVPMARKPSIAPSDKNNGMSITSEEEEEVEDDRASKNSKSAPASAKPKVVKKEIILPIFTEEEEEAIAEAKNPMLFSNKAVVQDASEIESPTSKVPEEEVKPVNQKSTAKSSSLSKDLTMKLKSSSIGNLTGSRGNLQQTKDLQSGSKNSLKVSGSIDSIKALTKELSNSLAKLVKQSDDLISPSTEKLKISTKDMDFMLPVSPTNKQSTQNLPSATEVKIEKEPKILPGTVENVGNASSADTASPQPPAAISPPSASSPPPGPSAVVAATTEEPKPKEKKKVVASKKPIPFSKRTTQGFGGASGTNAENDLLAQLDHIASSSGISLPKMESIHTRASSNASSRAPVDDSPVSPVLPAEKIESNDTPIAEKVVKEVVAEDPPTPKTPVLSKKELAAALKPTSEPQPTSIPPSLASSAIKKTATSSVASSPSSSAKSSPNNPRKPRDPSFKSVKKESKFGKIGDTGTSSLKKGHSVKNPSALSKSGHSNVSVSNASEKSADPEEEIETKEEEEEEEAPVAIKPTGTGSLGTTIDIKKVKQRQSYMPGNPNSQINRRADNVFSLDAMLGGVAETELIDKRDKKDRK